MGVSYVVEGDALHGLVLLQGVHLVQVAVSDEHSAVLRLVETVDLGNTKPPHQSPHKLKCTHTHVNSPAGRRSKPGTVGFICLCRQNHVVCSCG